MSCYQEFQKYEQLCGKETGTYQDIQRDIESFVDACIRDGQIEEVLNSNSKALRNLQTPRDGLNSCDSALIAWKACTGKFIIYRLKQAKQSGNAAASSSPGASSQGGQTAQSNPASERDNTVNQMRSQSQQRRTEYERKHEYSPKRHNPALVATGCLVKSPQGKRALYNKCDFAVEADVCMEEPSFPPGGGAYNEMGWAFNCAKDQLAGTRIGAHKHDWGAWNGKRLHFFACKAEKPYTVFALGEFDHVKNRMVGRCSD